jgi:hypothetical protein
MPHFSYVDIKNQGLKRFLGNFLNVHLNEKIISNSQCHIKATHIMLRDLLTQKSMD